MPRRARAAAIGALLACVGGLAAMVLVPPACTPGRALCTRDRECAADEVCYADGHCLRRDLAARAGVPLGPQCGHDDEGCFVPGYCVDGWCVGEPADAAPIVFDAGRPDARVPDALDAGGKPPVFAGAIGAYPDGDGALLVYWTDASDDVSLPTAIQYDVYRGEAPGLVDLATPVGVVMQTRAFHDPGRTVGQTYAYIVRARDEAGNEDTNFIEVTATARALVPPPPGVDFATQILPILQHRCVLCHGGASGLFLDSYAHLANGGNHGDLVVPCHPEQSHISQKLGPGPPFGLRMPRTGPPYLPMEQLALIDRWIADGAGPVYDARTCDQTAPLFAGATDLAVISPTACRASWLPASDTVSPPGAIRYRAWVGAVSGAENLTGPPTAESTPGAGSIDLGGLVSGTPVFVIVRAVDEAGNLDANLVEKTCTPG